MKVINIADIESFNQLYRQYEQKEANDVKNLLLLFVASDHPTTKQSWCSDCRNSKPIIDETIEKFQYNEQLCLAIVQVGQKDEWKDSQNPYRIHSLHISAVPTLISLNNGLRLVEAECADAAKVSHLFSNSM